MRNKGLKIGEACLVRLHASLLFYQSRSGSRGGRVLGVYKEG